MKILSILTFLFLSAFSIFAQEPGTTDKTIQKIEQYLQWESRQGFAGSIIIAKGGKTILSKGYGLANREKNIPNSSQTIFTTGSITKQFTAAAILKLEMQGKLKTQDPITKFFPDVPEDKKNITLHHLLTHSAGFPGAIGDDYEKVQRDDFIKKAFATPLLFTPGSKYEYSNVGYSILGAVIEKASGTDYETYLNKNLFKDAGMTNTGYVIPKWDTEKLSVGYKKGNRWGTSLEKPWDKDGPYWNLKCNGGILSTTENMLRWHEALSGNKILNLEAKNKMYTPHIAEGEGADSHYGYGWAVFKTPRNTRLITHNGGNGIFFSDFLRYIDENVAIYLSSNANVRGQQEIAWKVGRMIFNPGFFPDTTSRKPTLLKELPSGKEGERMRSFFSMLERGDETKAIQFARDNFSEEFLNQIPIEKHGKMMGRMQQDIGPAEILEIGQTGKKSFEVKIRSKKNGTTVVVGFEFDRSDDSKIIGMMMQEAE